MASAKQRLGGPVTNRTWALLASVGLMVIGIEGVWALAVDREWLWIQLIAFLIGLGSFIDVVRRWREI